MFASFILTSLAFVPALQASASDAEAAQEQTTDEIVVTAPENVGTRRAQLRKMADIVLRKPLTDRPTARYLKQLCPEVLGLTEEAGQLIRAKMKEYATELGIPFRQRESCTPNATLAFIAASDGKADTWLNSKSRSLRHLLSFQRVEVINERGPARAWNVSYERDYDGRPLARLGGLGIESASAPNFLNNVRLASRFSYPTTNEIVDATVLIELSAVDGKTVEQLASYGLLRIAAGVRLPRASQADQVSTILTLFDEDGFIPEELTEFDRALLAKLYSIPANAKSQRLHGSIAALALANEMETGELSQDDSAE